MGLAPCQFFALDLGTSKFQLLSLSENKATKTWAIDSVKVAASGMHRGMVADISAAKIALNLLIESAEKKFQTDVRKVTVGVAGSHLKPFNTTRSLSLHNQNVNKDHLQNLADEAQKMETEKNREIIHAVNLSFNVDSRPAGDSVLNLSGQTLQGKFFIVDADKNYLRDVITLCNQSGLEVVQFFAEPFASASVTLSEEDKKNGIALIDIGGGTADGVIFLEGKPCHLFTVNIAGHLMTKDLALGLKIPSEEAEKVKFFFGIDTHFDLGVLEVKNLKGHSVLLTAKDVYPILTARVDELISHVEREIQPFRSRLSLLLTGGASHCKGIEKRFFEKTKLETKIISPNADFFRSRMGKVDLQTELERSARYATGLGLLNLSAGKFFDNQENGPTSGKYIQYLWNWLKELGK